VAQSECIGCEERFVSVESFDAHRRDATAAELATDKWLRRRCVAAGEMNTRGWELTRNGWRYPKGVRKVAKLASARGAQAP
jgi:hypothetical protein